MRYRPGVSKLLPDSPLLVFVDKVLLGYNHAPFIYILPRAVFTQHGRVE